MPRKPLPAWQQVLLTALNTVSKAKDGRDAWQKLNENEQAAVMSFLGEHCGHDPEQAQAMLDETAGMVKPRSEKWMIALGVVLASIVAIWAFWALGKHFGDLNGYVLILLCLSRLVQAWNVTPTTRMAQVWSEHLANHNGTASALKEMERLLSLSKKELRSKGALIYYAVLLTVVVVVEVCSALTII